MTLGGRVSIFGWQTRSHLPDTHLSHIGEKLSYPPNSQIQLYTHSLSKSNLHLSFVSIDTCPILDEKLSYPANSQIHLYTHSLSKPNLHISFVSIRTCPKLEKSYDILQTVESHCRLDGSSLSKSNPFFFWFLACTEQISLSHILLFFRFNDSIFEHSKAMGVWYFIGWL